MVQRSVKNRSVVLELGHVGMMISRRELNPAVGSTFDIRMLVDKPPRPMQPRDQLGGFFRNADLTLQATE